MLHTKFRGNRPAGSICLHENVGLNVYCKVTLNSYNGSFQVY